MKPIDRTQIAGLIAVLSGLVAVSAPVLGIVAIWQEDLRWLYTAGAILLLAGVLFLVAQQTWPAPPTEEQRGRAR